MKNGIKKHLNVSNGLVVPILAICLFLTNSCLATFEYRSPLVDLSSSFMVTNGAITGATNTNWDTAYSKRVDTWTSPLSWSNNTASIANAAADNTTKGAASFYSADFDSVAGEIFIDYTNGQNASATTKGFLTAANWTTFNNKEPAITVGTAAQYWRGDKSFQTLNQAAVAGLTTADSPTFTGLTVGTLNGFIKGSTGVLSADTFGTTAYIPYSNGTGFTYSAQLQKTTPAGQSVLGLYGDINAGGITITSLLVGNSGTAQGYFAMQYQNAAAAGAPYGRLSFQPRNNADTAAFDGGNFQWNKIATLDSTNFAISTASAAVSLEGYRQDRGANIFNNNQNASCSVRIRGDVDSYLFMADVDNNANCFGNHPQIAATTGVKLATFSATTPQFRICYDSTHYANFSVASTGALTIAPTTTTTTNITGALNVSTTLGVTGDVAINTNKFNVTASSGNIDTAGKVTTYNNIATEGYGVPAIVDHVSLTAQTADITATNCTNAGTAGHYRVSYYLQDTTSDVTAGAVTLTFGFTDDAGATTVSSAALPLTAAGRTSGIFYVRLASGNLTYSTTHTGLFGTSQYRVDFTVERVN